MKRISFFLLSGLMALQYAIAQVGSHQYRRVAPDDMEEYLKRETTYWQKFAENEVQKGNLTFWAILQRIDGMDQDTEPNILIVNTFNDIDKGVDWSSVTELFPGVPMEDIQTQTLSKNTDLILVRNLDNHIRKENAIPEDDYNYVYVTYHRVNNLNAHLAFEADKWKPLAQKAMKEGKTNLTGWGNGIVVLPRSNAFDYSSFSYDLFGSMTGALSPYFSEGFVPDGFWDGTTDYYLGRNSHLYRIVAAVQAPAD